MIKKMYHGKIYYGYFIVAAAFIIMASSLGIVFNTASLFLKPIGDDLGFTQSAISATLAIRSVTQMVVSLFSWKIFSKYNLRNIMKLSSIVLAISFFSYSMARTLPLFYIITVIVSLSFSLVSMLPLSLILSNWFNERLGTVIGIAFMGSGIGGMIFNSLAGKWILEYGWRSAYQILAIIVFLTVTPCIFFIIRIHPRDVGLKPLGESSETRSDSNILNGGLMLKEAMKTNRFWIVILCSILISMSINTLIMTTSPHLTNIGYSITYSANIVALCMGSIAFGKLILGYLYDRLGVKIATLISCISTLVGLLGLIKFGGSFALIVLTIGAGIGGAHGTVGPPIITQSLYGKRDYGAIYGIVFAANSVGAALGPFISGLIYDLTGSYIFSFKFMLVVAFLIMIIYLFTLPREKAAIKVRANV